MRRLPFSAFGDRARPAKRVRSRRSPNARCKRFAGPCTCLNSPRPRTPTRLRQRFQHVAETLAPDPQAVAARSGKVFKVPPLVDQPLSPSVEFALAITIQRPCAVAAYPPFPACQPRPAVDPVCHRHDQALEPAGTQAAKQPVVVLHPTPIQIITNLTFRPRLVPLAACVLHRDVAIARSTERNIQPRDFLFQAEPFRIDHDRREERHGGAQPRDRNPDLVHRLGIGRARTALMRPDARDAVPRNFLKCGCAIEVCRRRDLVPAGRSRWAGPHLVGCPPASECSQSSTRQI